MMAVVVAGMEAGWAEVTTAGVMGAAAAAEGVEEEEAVAVAEVVVVVEQRCIQVHKFQIPIRTTIRFISNPHVHVPVTFHSPSSPAHLRCRKRMKTPSEIALRLGQQ